MAKLQAQITAEKDGFLREIQDRLRTVVTVFIRDIFNYERIVVEVNESTATGMGRTAIAPTKLTEHDGHSSYHFFYRHVGRGVHDFEIKYIPAVSNCTHIALFFQTIVDYIHNFYENLLNGYASSTDVESFMPHINRAKTWLYNIEQTVMIQYLYRIFNSGRLGPTDYYPEVQHERFKVEYISRMLAFAIELNTRKIENEEIYCGFVFHSSIHDIRNNSMLRIGFKNPMDFGDFGGLKNYLNTSNGQDTFFNVTDEKVTHLFVTKTKVNEVYMNPSADGKTFDTRPMILSVQGVGKILFIEGRREKNQPILEINNSKPLIRDGVFVQRFIESVLSRLNAPAERIPFFAKWIMSLSQRKHGTSLIFLEVNEATEKELVKSQPIKEEDGDLYNNSQRHDMFLLNSITKPDGAVIFNNELVPTHISSILPIDPKINTGQKTGGARHNSVSNFTQVYNCTGIVISEDGPISIFQKGYRIIKF